MGKTFNMHYNWQDYVSRDTNHSLTKKILDNSSILKAGVKTIFYYIEYIKWIHKTPLKKIIFGEFFKTFPNTLIHQIDDVLPKDSIIIKYSFWDFFENYKEIICISQFLLQNKNTC